MQPRTLALVLLALAVACAPARRSSPGNGGDDDDSGGVDGGGGGSDPYSGSCGTVDEPQSTPLPLPDTNEGNENPSCTTDADCPSSLPNCIITADTVDGGGPGFCAVSYTDTLNFIGFGSGATLTDPSTQLISICATMEHSWLGDLQIEIVAPDGKTAAMRQFVGRDVSEFFLGHANDCDSDDDPVPGVGYQYCWTPQGSYHLLDATNDDCGAPGGCETWADTACDGPHQVVPAGSNYAPDTSFNNLMGAPLNGDWTFRVTDLWAIDNGFLFDWSIQFNSSLVANCSQPIIQ